MRSFSFEWGLRICQVIFIVGGLLEYLLATRSSQDSSRLFHQVYSSRNLLFFIISLIPVGLMMRRLRIIPERDMSYRGSPASDFDTCLTGPGKEYYRLEQRVLFLALLPLALDTIHRIAGFLFSQTLMRQIEQRYFIGPSFPQHLAFGFAFPLIFMQILPQRDDHAGSGPGNSMVVRVLPYLITLVVSLVWEGIEVLLPKYFTAQDFWADMLANGMGMALCWLGCRLWSPTLLREKSISDLRKNPQDLKQVPDQGKGSS